MNMKIWLKRWLILSVIVSILLVIRYRIAASRGMADSIGIIGDIWVSIWAVLFSACIVIAAWFCSFLYTKYRSRHKNHAAS
jgi:hypothetical protein